MSFRIIREGDKWQDSDHMEWRGSELRESICIWHIFIHGKIAVLKNLVLPQLLVSLDRHLKFYNGENSIPSLLGG